MGRLDMALAGGRGERQMDHRGDLGLIPGEGLEAVFDRIQDGMPVEMGENVLPCYNAHLLLVPLSLAGWARRIGPGRFRAGHPAFYVAWPRYRLLV